MSWHYQALLTDIQCGCGGNTIPILQVHEVYTKEYGYTLEGMKPNVFLEEDEELDIEKMRADLINILEMMLNDVRKYPALDKRDE